eukprot:COSAG05_NODE_1627_length_4376_cov_3.480945_2_plen_106_part_00
MPETAPVVLAPIAAFGQQARPTRRAAERRAPPAAAGVYGVIWVTAKQEYGQENQGGERNRNCRRGAGHDSAAATRSDRWARPHAHAACRQALSLLYTIPVSRPRA